MTGIATMKPWTKALLVVVGYVLAIAVACVAVGIYMSATSGPDRHTYGAMYDFGDFLLFLAVLGVAAIPATGAALYFLRPYPLFWRVVSVVAIGIATTGIAALLDYLVPRGAGVESLLGAWPMVSPLRILAAPLFAIGFFLSALFAPIRSCRYLLLGATAIEAFVFVRVALIWMHPFDGT